MTVSLDYCEFSLADTEMNSSLSWILLFAFNFLFELVWSFWCCVLTAPIFSCSVSSFTVAMPWSPRMLYVGKLMCIVVAFCCTELLRTRFDINLKCFWFFSTICMFLCFNLMLSFLKTRRLLRLSLRSKLSSRWLPGAFIRWWSSSPYGPSLIEDSTEFIVLVACCEFTENLLFPKYRPLPSLTMPPRMAAP